MLNNIKPTWQLANPSHILHTSLSRASSCCHKGQHHPLRLVSKPSFGSFNFGNPLAAAAVIIFVLFIFIFFSLYFPDTERENPRTPTPTDRHHHHRLRHSRRRRRRPCLGDHHRRSSWLADWLDTFKISHTNTHHTK